MGTLKGCPNPPAMEPVERSSPGSDATVRRHGSAARTRAARARSHAAARSLGADPPPFRHVEQQRGVALGMFAEDISFSYAPLLAEIVALGATHVALVVPLYQADATATTSAWTRGYRRP